MNVILKAKAGLVKELLYINECFLLHQCVISKTARGAGGLCDGLTHKNVSKNNKGERETECTEL